MTPLFWKTEQRTVNELVPYEQNPRKMTETQVEHLRKSIERFDLVEIPAINADNTLIAGHQRMRVMQMLGRGHDLIDVRVPNRALTEKELKEYNVRSNQNHGDFDFDLLGSLFDEEELFDIGFSEKDLGVIGFHDEVTEEELKQKEYALLFDTEEDYVDFVELLKKVRGDRQLTLSYALLTFLKENVV